MLDRFSNIHHHTCPVSRKIRCKHLWLRFSRESLAGNDANIRSGNLLIKSIQPILWHVRLLGVNSAHDQTQFSMLGLRSEICAGLGINHSMPSKSFTTIDREPQFIQFLLSPRNGILNGIRLSKIGIFVKLGFLEVPGQCGLQTR